MLCFHEIRRHLHKWTEVNSYHFQETRRIIFRGKCRRFILYLYFVVFSFMWLQEIQSTGCFKNWFMYRVTSVLLDLCDFKA